MTKTLNTKQLGILFGEIAGLALSVREDVFFTCTDDDEAVASLIWRIRETVMRMGWCADLGARAVGGYQQVGNAEDWLLPPIFHDAGKKAETDPASAEGES